MLIIFAGAAVALCLALLVRHRICHVLDRDTSWAYLMGRTPWHAASFDPIAVESLPEPARRFFKAALGPDLALPPIAQLKLTETIQGRRNVWHQMLAFPHGSMRRLTSCGLLPLTMTLGIEGRRVLVRRWLLWLIPLPAPAMTPEQLFDRMMVDAALWTPAALLSDDRVSWFALDGDRASISFADNGFDRKVEIEIDPTGALVRIRAETLSARPTAYADHFGYRLPSLVMIEEAGRTSALTLDRIRFIEPWTGRSHS